jgi:ribosome-interacting GTPase 1
MPMNAPAEYYALIEKYKLASTKEEKIKILEEMLKVLPKHKGTEKEIGQIRKRIAKLKAEKKTLGKSIKGIRKIWPRITFFLEDASKILSLFNLKRFGDFYFGTVYIRNAPAQIVAIDKEDKQILEQSELILNSIANEEEIYQKLKEKGIVVVKLNDKYVFVKEGEEIEKLLEDLPKGWSAKLFGPNTKFQGMKIGADYKLKEGDEIIYERNK